MKQVLVLCAAPTIQYFLYNIGQHFMRIISLEWELNERMYEKPMAIKYINSVEKKFFAERPQLMCDYPLNLSILIRGGKETKWDSPSSGERNGISSARRVMDFTVH